MTSPEIQLLTPDTPEWFDATRLIFREYADAIGKSTRTVQRWLAEGIIASDAKLPGPTGDHLFLADRAQADRQGSVA